MAVPPSRSNPPAFNVPPATLWSSAVMLVIYVIVNIATGPAAEWIIVTFAFIPVRLLIFLEGGDVGAIEAFLPLVTHIFLHVDFMHIFMNGGMLLAFGSLVERILGTRRYVVLFLVSGIAGGLAQLLLGPHPNVILFGASGAVFGAMGATVHVIYRRMGASRALAFAGILMGLNLVFGATAIGSMLVGEDAAISWQAHIGGFLAGVIAFPLLLGARRRFF